MFGDIKNCILTQENTMIREKLCFHSKVQLKLSGLVIISMILRDISSLGNKKVKNSYDTQFIVATLSVRK